MALEYTEFTICPLATLGVLHFDGPDAGAFLQGQLSCDTGELSGELLLPAGWHNPQGRVLALLRVGLAGSERIVAVLEREMVAIAAEQLRRFVLRAKVTITDASDHVAVFGLLPELPGALAPAAPVGALIYRDSTAARWLLLQPASAAPPAELSAAGRWHAALLAAGFPTVGRAISGQFVAQMLNLDCLGAISFTKGCYTGQEVIARAHYRGKVKRRMQRFLTRAAAQLAPAEHYRLADGRGVQLVAAQARPDGRSELLAVAPLTATAAADAAASGAPLLECENLPLPYALPA
jgi:tRNA-modifying protein YgfZ